MTNPVELSPGAPTTPVRPADRAAPVDTTHGSFDSHLRRAQAPRTIAPPKPKGDIDGDGVISKAEQLLARIKDMIAMLMHDLAHRPDLDKQALREGIQRLSQLGAELEERIKGGDPVTDADRLAIADEAMDIWMRARQTVGTDDDGVRTERDDGHIEWSSPSSRRGR